MDSYHQSQFVPHRDEIAYTSATIPLRRVGEDGDGSPVERRQRRSDSDASSDFGTGANMHESRRTHATKLAWLDTRRVSRSWGLEGLFVLLSIGALCGIAGVAARFDNKSSSAWSFGVPITTLVSFLASVLEGCLLLSIFLTFARLTSMHRENQTESTTNLQEFKSSGKGLSSRAPAVWPWHIILIAILGISSALLALFTGPSTLQLLAYEQVALQDPDHQDDPMIPICNKNYASSSPGMNYTTFLSTFDPNDIDFPVREAIWSALYSSAPPILCKEDWCLCSTNNCTWEPYSTLTVCSQCTDIKSKLSKDNDLPAPYNLNGSSSYFQIRHLDTANSTDIAHFATLSTLGAAFECSLNYCVQSINGSANATTLTETFLASFDDATWDNPTDMAMLQLAPPANLNISNATFAVPVLDLWKNRAWLQTIWNSTALPTSQDRYKYAQTPELEALEGAEGTDGYVPNTVARIALAMGYAIRNGGNTYYSSALTGGTAWTTDTFLRVDWRWIALPTTAVGLAVGFVGAATAAATRV